MRAEESLSSDMADRAVNHNDGHLTFYFEGALRELDEPRKEVGYVVFLLAFFAVVLQMCSGTEIQVLPSFVFHEADRLQTIGTTLHIYAACFRISPPTQHLVEI